MQVQARHQLHAMVFDGLGANLQRLGDLLGVLAFGNKPENLALPNCQLFERAFLVNTSIPSGIFEEARGGFLAEINFLRKHILQGGLRLLDPRLVAGLTH